MTDSGADVDTTQSRTPAFHRLHIHEQDITQELRDGFKDIDDVLLWVLEASKLTLGYLDDDFGRTLLTDPYRVDALTNTDYGTDAAANHVQVQEIVEDDLAPAFNSARAFVRQNAQDYDEEVDASKQAHTALIPRVDVVAAAQRKAIEWAIDYDGGATNYPGPIENREDVSDWVKQVGFATTAFLDDDVIEQVTSLGTSWRHHLVRGQGTSLRVLIARDLLPPMNKAINDAATAGMEQSQRKHTSETGGSIS